MDDDRDERIVMTLDAGGTNFVFSAIRGGTDAVKPVTLPSHGDNLEQCLQTIQDGFSNVAGCLAEKPAAISFAFPGPADYPAGIIGDLGNLPAFRGGVALGPMLEEKFKMPVFINNDGDLYAYGEAIAGYLPFVNDLLKKSGCVKRYRNLAGFTLGTGFGAGIVSDNRLLRGDNSGAGEVWLLRSKLDPEMNVEENISIRGVRRFYSEAAGLPFDKSPSPKEIAGIADGKTEGDRDAAIHAYASLGEELGNVLANLLTLVDGIAVVGGGLSGAHRLFFPSMIAEMNSTYQNRRGQIYRRLVPAAYDLEDQDQQEQFLKGEEKTITVPGSGRTMMYDRQVRVGVGVSRIGTSKAVALGAYAFALNELNR